MRAFAASISALATMLMLGAPASAQDVPPDQITPPIRYSLPPGDSSQPQVPEPAPSPTPAPSPAPTPRSNPTPAASPTPARATPPLVVTPAPAPSPTPSATATPRPGPTPTGTPTATPTPQATPVAPPTGLPDDTAPIELSPTAAAPVASSPTPGVDSAQAPANRGGNWTWWMLGAGLALVAAAAVVAWRRRDAPNLPEADTAPVELAPPVLAPTPPMRRVAAAAPEQQAPAPAANGGPQFLSVPAQPVQREPVAAPKLAPDGTIKAFQNRPSAPPTPPADAGFITAFKSTAGAAPMLALELQPIRAGCTEDSGYVEYTFAVVNPSDVVVGDLLVSAWLVSANPQQDRQLLDYLAEPADPSRHNVFALRPGEHRELRAAMGVPFDQLHLVEAAGRRFFAPMLLLDARYRTQNGTPGRTSAAYMIGKPHPSSGKLAPVFVDRGPRVVEGLAARPYRLPRGAGS